MNEQDSEFEDPALRGAVRRACGRQTAPPELRRRVEGLMGAAMAAAPVEARAPRRWPNWIGATPLKFAAAAAVCFIAVGVAGMQAWDTFGPQPTPPRVQRVSFPVSMTAGMIRTHDNCAKLTDHHLVAGNDPTTLLAQLSHAALAPQAAINLSGGWRFKGAGLCAVGDTQAAHLMFARDKDTISIFSLTAPRSCRHGTSSVYRAVVDGHAIAAFVYGGSMYGVIGSSPNNEVTLDDIEPLAAQVENCVGASGCEGVEPGPFTAAPSSTTNSSTTVQ